MSTEFVYYVATSIDGRIAGPGHDLAFLEQLEGAAGFEDDFERFEASVDAIVMGARTWGFLIAHGSWPHGDLPVWVVTGSQQVPALDGARVSTFGGDVTELVTQLRLAGHRRVWIVGGGTLAAQLAAIDAIDEIILTISPTLLGAGPALVDAAGALPLASFERTDLRPYGDAGVRVVWRHRGSAD